MLLQTSNRDRQMWASAPTGLIEVLADGNQEREERATARWTASPT